VKWRTHLRYILNFMLSINHTLKWLLAVTMSNYTKLIFRPCFANEKYRNTNFPKLSFLRYHCTNCKKLAHSSRNKNSARWRIFGVICLLIGKRRGDQSSHSLKRVRNTLTCTGLCAEKCARHRVGGT
jgi:hypothetical protein